MTVPDRTPGEELSDLWAMFKSSADPQARDALIIRYKPVVEFVARRMGFGSAPDFDPSNRFANGVLGLIEAIDKFEPERGFKFETYAINRIKSSILDGERGS